MKSSLSLGALSLALVAVGSVCVAQTGAEAPLMRESFVFEGSAFLPECYKPNLVNLPDGALSCAWSTGAGRMALDLSIRISFKPAKSAQWSRPLPVPNQVGYPDHNPILAWLPGTGLRLFYVSLYQDTRKATPGIDMASWHLMYRDTADRGRTWRGEYFLIPESDWIPSARVLTLSNGDLLLPITDVSRRVPLFLVSKDKGHYWKETPPIADASELVEPIVVETAPGNLLAFLRPDEQGRRQRLLWRTESKDNGRTWARPQATELLNPGGAADIIRLRNGHLAMAHNDGNQWLTPLTARISTDGGRTWPYKRDLVTEQWDQRDPSLVETDDGHIHVVYVYRSIHLKHAEFNEAWIREAR